jgi:magnesium-transporting ATPase (P-type)
MEILSIIGTIAFVAVVALSLLAVLDIFFKSDKKKMRKRKAAMRKLKHERPTWSRK